MKPTAVYDSMSHAFWDAYIDHKLTIMTEWAGTDNPEWCDFIGCYCGL